MEILNGKGASIYDVRTEGGGRGQKIPQICGQTVHKIRTRGGGAGVVKESENFADIINVLVA